jgi:Meiotically up-regulated gene 113
MLLYIAGDKEEGPLKLGTAADHKKRLGGLQTGNPQRLRIMRSWPHEHARRIEGILKNKLAAHRMPGGSEWFNLSLKQLLVYVEPYFPDPLPPPDEPEPEVECHLLVGTKTVTFFCDHCQEWWLHGAGEKPLTSPYLGHRGQHCHDFGGCPYPHGYVLVGGKPATTEIEKAYRARRPPLSVPEDDTVCDWLIAECEFGASAKDGKEALLVLKKRCEDWAKRQNKALGGEALSMKAFRNALHRMGIATKDDKGRSVQVSGAFVGRDYVDGAKGIRLKVRVGQGS